MVHLLFFLVGSVFLFIPKYAECGLVKLLEQKPRTVNIRHNVPSNISFQFASYNAIVNWMDEICHLHSDIASCLLIGSSLQGRQLKVLQLSGSDTPWRRERKALFLECGAHAREWASILPTVALIQELLRTRVMLDNFGWYVLLLMNPDGYDKTRRPVEKSYFENFKNVNRMWPKNAAPTGVELNITYVGKDELNLDSYEICFPGTDLNRNFPFHWEEDEEELCYDDYPGKSVASEPETRAVIDFVTRIKKNLIAYLSIHAYGQRIYLPFACTPNVKADDYDELTRVADIVSRRIAIENERKYLVDEHPYKACGTSADWAKSLGIKYVYTIEVYPSKDSDWNAYDYDDYKIGYRIRPENITSIASDLWCAVTAIAEEIEAF